MFIFAPLSEGSLELFRLTNSFSCSRPGFQWCPLSSVQYDNQQAEAWNLPEKLFHGSRCGVKKRKYSFTKCFLWALWLDERKSRCHKPTPWKDLHLPRPAAVTFDPWPDWLYLWNHWLWCYNAVSWNDWSVKCKCETLLNLQFGGKEKFCTFTIRNSLKTPQITALLHEINLIN